MDRARSDDREMSIIASTPSHCCSGQPSSSQAARPYHPAERVKGGRAVNLDGHQHWPRCGCLSSWSLVPHLLKCWRDGLTEEVPKRCSRRAPSGSCFGSGMGFRRNPPVVILSSINLVLSITILALTLRKSSPPEAHTARRDERTRDCRLIWRRRYRAPIFKAPSMCPDPNSRLRREGRTWKWSCCRKTKAGREKRVARL